jgi:predicted transcriptional regulator
MKTELAVKHAGSVKALADLLGVTSSAISQWGEDVPEARVWQLRVLKPEWFAANDETQAQSASS